MLEYPHVFPTKSDFSKLCNMTDTHEPVPVKQVITGTWREIVAKWLFDQSVPTVLLFANFTAVVWGIPRYVIPAIQAGYRENAESLKRTEELRAEAIRLQFQLIFESHDRDRKAFERAMDALEQRM